LAETSCQHFLRGVLSRQIETGSLKTSRRNREGKDAGRWTSLRLSWSGGVKPDAPEEGRRSRCKVVGPFDRNAEPKNFAERLERVAGTAR